MTLPEYYELVEYWSDNPPMDVVVFAMAQSFGLKKKPAATRDSGARSLKADFRDGVIR